MQWGGNWGKIREKPVGGSVGPQGVPAEPEPAAEPPSPPQAGCPAGPRPAACRGLPGEAADSLQDRKGWVRLAGVCKDRGLVFCRSISRAVIINQYKG